jgi:hypothetical protein
MSLVQKLKWLNSMSSMSVTRIIENNDTEVMKDDALIKKFCDHMWKHIPSHLPEPFSKAGNWKDMLTQVNRCNESVTLLAVRKVFVDAVEDGLNLETVWTMQLQHAYERMMAYLTDRAQEKLAVNMLVLMAMEVDEMDFDFTMGVINKMKRILEAGKIVRTEEK